MFLEFPVTMHNADTLSDTAVRSRLRSATLHTP